MNGLDSINSNDFARAGEKAGQTRNPTENQQEILLQKQRKQSFVPKLIINMNESSLIQIRRKYETKI